MSQSSHTTKAIILRSVKYGETSLVVTAFTELFGMQTYMLKGIRQSSKNKGNKVNYFLPASILDLQVIHHPQKQIQFIKEYQYSFLSKNIFFNVVKNAVAMFIVETLSHSLKQPDNNPSLFYFVENTLIDLDDANSKSTANLPLFFCLQLASELGFSIADNYSEENDIVDLKEGLFVKIPPHHPYYLTGNDAIITNEINIAKSIELLNDIALNKDRRKHLLDYYLLYLQLHIENFGEIKSLKVLSEILS